MVKRISYDAYEVQELDEDVKHNVYEKILEKNFNNIFKEVLVPWKKVLLSLFNNMPNKDLCVKINPLNENPLTFEVLQKYLKDKEVMSKEEWTDIKKLFFQKMNILKNKDFKYQTNKINTISEYIIQPIDNYYSSEKKPGISYSKIYEIVLDEFNNKVNIYINDIKEKMINDYIDNNQIVFSKNGDNIKLENYFTIEDVNNNINKP